MPNAVSPPRRPLPPSQKSRQLDIAAEFERVRQSYADDASNNTFNCLIQGDSGAGKTFLMKTARKPILYHGFDPGGEKPLREEILNGEVIPDMRFIHESTKNPRAFKLWDAEFTRLYRGDFFEHVGSFVIDSATTWGEAVLNQVQKERVRSFGKPPEIKDYLIQILTMKDYIKTCVSIPCDFYLLCHLQYKENEEGALISALPLITGKFAPYLPLLFDEVYYCDNKARATDTEYRLLTQKNGIYMAKSRFSEGGKIDKYEPADLKAIMKKVGMLRPDLPLHK